jgi:N-acetylmuramate 1-kinase
MKQIDPQSDARRQQWLRGEIPGSCLTPEAGLRRYFRSLDPEFHGWLRVTSPDPAPLPTTRFLQQCGVKVPAIGDATEGAYLVQDLGDRHLADDPHQDGYRQLVSCWHRFAFQDLPPAHPNRAMALDAALFRRELELFRDAYLEGACSIKITANLRAELRHAAERLAEHASSGPWSLQHRDFHSRNVLLTDEGEVALIDHQDLRPGPVFYDFASLATDAYVDLPNAVQSLIQHSVQTLGKRLGLSPEQSLIQYNYTALQRVLKALGTFGRLLLIGRLDYVPAAHRAHRHATQLLADVPGLRVYKEIWQQIEPPCPRAWSQRHASSSA